MSTAHSISFTASPRAATGSTATRALRATGRVPVTLSRPG